MTNSELLHDLIHKIVHLEVQMEEDRKEYEKHGIIHRKKREANLEKMLLLDQQLGQLLDKINKKGGE